MRAEVPAYRCSSEGIIPALKERGLGRAIDVYMEWAAAPEQHHPIVAASSRRPAFSPAGRGISPESSLPGDPSLP